MEELEKQEVLCLDRRIIKQYEYEAKINTNKEKADLANANQIVIRKLESGSILEFRKIDKTLISQIPVKNNNIYVYPTQRTKLKRWPKKAFSQQIKIQFLDREPQKQSITFNVDDVYLEDLTKEIDAIKSKDFIILDNIEDVEYHGNFKDVEKIVIVPIESMMTMNSGSVLEFRGIDDDVILQIPIKNISYAYPRAESLTKHWRRRILDLQIQIQFLDQQQHQQTLMFNVADRHIESIIKKIFELRAIDEQEYWRPDFVPNSIDGKGVTIFPRSLILGNDEKILWSNQKLDDITDTSIVKLQALTNFRIFKYDFEKHECQYLILSELEDTLVSDKKSFQHERRVTGAVPPSSLRNLAFVCHQKRDVIFDDIPDPDTLKQLAIRARDDLFEKQGKKHVFLRLTERIFSCSKCGQDYNPVGAYFCNKCRFELQDKLLHDPLQKHEKELA